MTAEGLWIALHCCLATRFQSRHSVFDRAFARRRRAHALTCYLSGRESCTGMVRVAEGPVSAQRARARHRADRGAGSRQEHAGRPAGAPLSQAMTSGPSASSRSIQPVPTRAARFWATGSACRSILPIQEFTFAAWPRADRWAGWRAPPPMSRPCSMPRDAT